jgi:hypothetical protein
MFMNRRAFLRSSGLVAFGASVPWLSGFASASSNQGPFRWRTNDLMFSFDVKGGRLRQKCLVPAGAAPGANTSSGVEVALQCSGEDSPDQGMKSGVGQPGARLLFMARREEIWRTRSPRRQANAIVRLNQSKKQHPILVCDEAHLLCHPALDQFPLLLNFDMGLLSLLDLAARRPTVAAPDLVFAVA